MLLLSTTRCRGHLSQGFSQAKGVTGHAHRTRGLTVEIIEDFFLKQMVNWGFTEGDHHLFNQRDQDTKCIMAVPILHPETGRAAGVLVLDSVKRTTFMRGDASVRQAAEDNINFDALRNVLGFINKIRKSPSDPASLGSGELSLLNGIRNLSERVESFAVPPLALLLAKIPLWKQKR